MKTTKLFTAIALTALIGTTAAPAFAAPQMGPQAPARVERREDNFVFRLNDRVSELRQRLDRGYDRRQISRTELKRLKRDLDKIAVDIRNESRGVRALDRRDFERLNGRLDNLALRIHDQRTDHNRR